MTIIPALYVVIATTGIIGNILVMVAVALSCKLHTATNAFVVNLSVFDFLTCLVLPFQIVGIKATDGWPMSPAICTIVAAMAIITQSGSVITLALIGINRFVLITKPNDLYTRIYTPCRIGLMILFSWGLPLLALVVPQLIPGIGWLGYSHKYKVCLWDTTRNSAIVLQSIGAVTFLLSTAILIYCYLSIYHFVRKHYTGIHTRMQASASEDNLEVSPRLITGLNKRQIQITKNLGCVVVVFFLCVLPYTCILLYPTHQVVGIYIAMLFLLPSAINPMLYAAKHPHFRVVFSCMVRCRFSDIPQPSSGLKKLLKQSSTKSQISLAKEVC